MMKKTTNGNKSSINGSGVSRTNGKVQRDANGDGKEKSRPQQHKVSFSPKSLVLSIVLPVLFAFAAGRMARRYLFQRPSYAPASGSGTPFEEPVDSSIEEDSDEEEESNLSCLHFSVDMSDLPRDFLESKQMLSDAIAQALEESSLPEPKYYCHKQNKSVTCVALILLSDIGGRVSLHTTPHVGDMSLNVALCSQHEQQDPLQFVGTLINSFGQHMMSQQDNQQKNSSLAANQNVRWDVYHFLSDSAPPLDYITYMNFPEIKGIVASVESPFQHILIVESYGVEHPSVYRPEKVVHLNGQIQSTLYGDASYHEALVHPAMLAQANPQRVGIIGGGEGATLREVLKHNTVTEAVMVEIDEIMMQVSREYLPEWNTCQLGQTNKTTSCFDEPRATVYTQDALAWFMDRFDDSAGKTNPRGLDNAEPFDVIIMDALDPQDDSDFCKALYSNDIFYQTLFNALTSEGVLVMQIGEAPETEDAGDIRATFSNEDKIMEELERVGFESLHVYSEAHCYFGAPWTYLVAFKDYDTRLNWYSNEAEIELAIRERTIPTATGQSPLSYFDGATMVSYQIPHKVFETVFCGSEPQPKSCQEYRGFDSSRPHVPNRELEVKKSTVGENAGRGLFATRDIGKGSYIALDTGVDNVFFPPSTYYLVDEFSDYKESEAVEVYMDGYGFESDNFGPTEATVDSSTTTFVNHGCNGTYNIGFPSSGEVGLTENNADLDKVPHDLFESVEDYSLYNPALDRNLMRLSSAGDVALRDIKTGEELLSNYVMMHSELEGWKEWILSLRAECSGETVGTVSQYENDHQEEETQ